jgi:hypothetical protein
MYTLYVVIGEVRRTRLLYLAAFHNLKLGFKSLELAPRPFRDTLKTPQSRQ